jgi:hypothetical protein
MASDVNKLPLDDKTVDAIRDGGEPGARPTPVAPSTHNFGGMIAEREVVYIAKTTSTRQAVVDQDAAVVELDPTVRGEASGAYRLHGYTETRLTAANGTPRRFDLATLDGQQGCATLLFRSRDTVFSGLVEAEVQRLLVPVHKVSDPLVCALNLWPSRIANSNPVALAGLSQPAVRRWA